MVKIPSLLVIRSHDPAGRRRIWLILAGVWFGSLILAGLLGAALARSGSAVSEHSRVKSLDSENETLKDRVVVLQRSEQVAKAAVADLQQTLGDREEEIAGLRADLAFYGRLVGGTQREGLSVHTIKLTPMARSHAWNFVATLTQNFKRGKQTRGRLRIAIDGVREGKLAKLDWPALTQQKGADGLAFDFKYFEQIKGTIMLPQGFDPNRVRVTADGDFGHLQQVFSWEDAIKGEESDDVRQ
ncbi:MAG: DUF6776 family protein [Rhodanobacteraceae bacterium]